MGVLYMLFSLFYHGVLNNVVPFALSFATSIIGLLRIRMDVAYLDVADNDSRLGEISVTAFVETYGRFTTAIVYASVEILACFTFAFTHRLQGSLKYLLPVVQRRAQAVLRLLFDYMHSWVASYLARALQTPTGVGVWKRLSPLSPMLNQVHENMCVILGSDYIEKSPRKAGSIVSGVFEGFLDFIAPRAYQSTLLWMVYTPITIWFCFTLCGVSVILAFLTPYILRPASPLYNVNVSHCTGQPLENLPLAEAAASERPLSAVVEDNNRYIHAHIQSSTMYLNEASVADSDIDESPSLDLSTLLADPRAQVTSLMLYQIQPVVPEILVTLVDESTDLSFQLESFADLSISRPAQEHDTFGEGVSSQNGDSASPLPTSQSIASFEGLSVMLSPLENSNTDEIGCLDYSWEDDLFMHGQDRSLLINNPPATAATGILSTSHCQDAVTDATNIGQLDIMKISELSITNSNGDLCTAHVYLANDGFEIGQTGMGLMHADGPKNDNIDNAVFVNHIPLNNSKEVGSDATFNDHIDDSVLVGKTPPRTVDGASSATKINKIAQVDIISLASQVTSLGPAEATTILTSTITTTADSHGVFMNKDKFVQAGNADTILTDAQIEILAAVLVELDIEVVHAICGTVLDDILFSKGKSNSTTTDPPTDVLAPVLTPAPVAVTAKVVGLIDRFTDCQPPHPAPTGSKLYSVVQQPTPEVVIGRNDALWRASVRAGAAHRNGKIPTAARAGTSFHAPQRVTEGAENPMSSALWAPGRAGAVPIVVPPLSRRKRTVTVTEESAARAKAAAERRAEWLTRHALL